MTVSLLSRSDFSRWRDASTRSSAEAGLLPWLATALGGWRDGGDRGAAGAATAASTGPARSPADRGLPPHAPLG